MAKRRMAKTAGWAAILGLGLGIAQAQAADSKPIRMGTEPWLGYGQWDVASAKGIFAANGLSDVKIINFTEDKDLNAALASGQLDAANVATHTAMVMAASGLPIKIVMLLDFSLKADAILADKDIGSIAALKGKKVAFEQGTTSDILLNYALHANGMTISDVNVVPMPAADAGTALIAGRVPVAVTYEPYISAALAHGSNVKLLYTAGTDPGLISDVLVVRDDVLKSRPDAVKALIASWGAALEDYQAHTAADRAIIAKAVGDTPADLATAFDGVRYYSVSENKAALTGDFAHKTFLDVKQAAKNAGLPTDGVSADTLIDPSFVQSAQ
ncbi:MAG TPA: ABC transporter substrate-binding protein [Acidisoma sp.]|uniref:ABC transporter substrate-binding protein n=1 Tax=Acidisoma sp. TaxID=1872115 RepID=UPI002CCD00A8|nr:ABC transporter substrate-binding protein [Acidisoma sp.]HTI01346.1 ABC transporter substrate-binding protein [Acidisoma sp.]